MQIVAHRGARGQHPENTLPAFEEAIQLGADAIEMDVRLTADLQPIVYHYFYLRPVIDLPGTIFDYPLNELIKLPMRRSDGAYESSYHIATLHQALESLAGRIGLEIEIKGPEPECVDIIADALLPYRSLWHTIELTSYEPALLLAIQSRCPGIPTDLLIPRSESWMEMDVVAYAAAQRGRLAHARAVHLHPSQLTHHVIDTVHRSGLEIHAWDINTEADYLHIEEAGIPRICTDHLEWALNFQHSKIK